MPKRAASDTTPESELDISNNLLGEVGLGVHLGLDLDDKQNGESLFGAILNDDDDDETFIATQQAAANRRTTNVKGISKKKGGFQSMGLNAQLLKAVTRKGFSLPTPIQRQIIPSIIDGQDVVGMARTGSGKTAAFVIPIIEKLKEHSSMVGARAVVFSPSRELALQTLKNFKEFGRGTDLRSILLVGGDSLEEHFRELMSNPDIIIATPGRFMHLQVEMSLDLSSIQFAVFDEADRLFEMGFSQQLHEILHALPPFRQTLLFSATLPKSLVEFANAGLKEPNLVRLDAESKISPDLQSVFLTSRSTDKEGVLLHILNDLINMPQPLNSNEHSNEYSTEVKGKKRRKMIYPKDFRDMPVEQSTIIFAATKHHVEYLATLLQSCGFSVSFVYGSLDQTARRIQVEKFRSGLTQILVVTDVAARGIDIPMLANVINYDFPSQPKIFIHRVGRTARAGSKGWSYSLVQDSDVPYLLDIQQFLGRKLVLGNSTNTNFSFVADIVVGAVPRLQLDKNVELATKLLEENNDLEMLRTVAAKGENLYRKTRNSASAESAKEAKQIHMDVAFQQVNLLYKDETNDMQAEREKMLARIGGFRPSETVFEIGKRGQVDGTVDIIRRNREKNKMRKAKSNTENQDHARSTTTPSEDIQNEETAYSTSRDDLEASSESQSDEEFEVIVKNDSEQTKNKSGNYWQDSEHFMSYEPKSSNAVEDRGYAVNATSYDGSRSSNFAEAARDATFDLGADESKSFAEPSRMRWDKKSKKYVSRVNDEDGSKGKKLIRGESGQMIASSFRSGRFDAWKKSNRLGRLPKKGEQESSIRSEGSDHNRHGKRFKYDADKAPKNPDKYRDDYHKQKKKVEKAQERNVSGAGSRPAKDELRGIDDVRKARKLKQKRREKNARPARKKI